MERKMPFLKKEYFSQFTLDFLGMSRVELQDKMTIADVEREGTQILFYTTVRSLYTNKVLVKRDRPRFYFGAVPSCNEFSTLAELSILAAKDVLGAFIDLDNDTVKELVAVSTQPYPAFVGVICDKPIVYMNVLCDDGWVNSDERQKCLAPDSEWRNIADLKFADSIVSKTLYERLKICNKERRANNGI